MGTTVSLSDSSYLDLHGILWRPKSSWDKHIDKLDEKLPVYIYDMKNHCRLSLSPLFLFVSGENRYLHFSDQLEHVELLQTISGKTSLIPEQSKTQISACKVSGKVTYGD